MEEQLVAEKQQVLAAKGQTDYEEALAEFKKHVEESGLGDTEKEELLSGLDE